MKKSLSIIILCILSTSIFSQTSSLPRVKILATGGTIAGAGNAADRAGYKAGALPIDELLAAVPQILRYKFDEQIASRSRYNCRDLAKARRPYQ